MLQRPERQSKVMLVGMYSQIKPMVERLSSEGKSEVEAVHLALKEYNPIYSVLKLKTVELGNGRAVVEFPFLKEFVNPNGTLHGGIIAAVIDQVGAIASWTSHRGENQVTLELKINYLRPVTEDEAPFRAVGEVIKSGRSTVVTEIKIYGSSGSILAVGLGTWFK